jgi:hypothetical protein
VDIVERDRLRFAFLKLLYKRVGGRRRGGYDMWSIGRALDLDRRATAGVFEYLNDAGLAEFRAAGGLVGLTHDGVCAIEKTVREPQTARDYFPEINIIAVENMISSQIQQGTGDATQAMTPNGGREMNIRQKDEQRLAFLHRLYELVDGLTSRMITQSEVGAALGFDDETIDEVVEYLSDQHLVERRAFGGMIGITAYGVDEVEEALRGPREGTVHFPSQVINNVLIANSIQGSQIQMGTSHSTQTMQTADLETVRALVRELRAAIAELEFTDETTSRDVTADLDSLESQLRRSTPKTSMIRELLTSVRHTLEGAGGGVLAEHADKIGDLVEKIEHVTRALPG